MTAPDTKRWDIASIRASNLARVTPEPWFSRGNMKMFHTRVLRTVYQGPGGVYFVTGERCPGGMFREDYLGPERYSVRQFNPDDSSVRTVGDFHRFGLVGYARNRAKVLAKGGQ